MKKTLLIIALVTLISCKNDAQKLPTHFKSYDEAIQKVESYDFKYNDSFNTNNLSEKNWISEAEFYSVDNKTGFLILELTGRKYIYQNVPFLIWEEFKKSDDIGKFYHKKIKNKYNFRLNNQR